MQESREVLGNQMQLSLSLLSELLSECLFRSSVHSHSFSKEQASTSKHAVIKIYVLRVCNPHGSCGTWNEYLHYTRDALSIWRFEVNDANHKLSQFSYDIAVIWRHKKYQICVPKVVRRSIIPTRG